LISKIAWADAEKPNHLVLFTTSYFSNSSRLWIEKIQQDKSYKIHILEKKIIKNLVINTFPELIEKYFVNKFEKLLLDAMQNWLIHDLLPDPQMLSLLIKNIELNKLHPNEIAFLWCSSKYLYDEVNEWCLEEENEPFSTDFLYYYLANMSNCTEPLFNKESKIQIINTSIGGSDWDYVYNKCFRAKILYGDSLSMYTFVHDSDGEGIEVFIEANGSFTVKIRYIEYNAKQELMEIIKLFHEEFNSV